MQSTEVMIEWVVRGRLANLIAQVSILFCHCLFRTPLLTILTSRWISDGVLLAKSCHLSSILLVGHGFELLKFMEKTNGTS